jgi:hypothetical protein
MANNHTGKKQLEGWEQLIEAAYQIYKTSPRCQTADNMRGFLGESHWLAFRSCQGPEEIILSDSCHENSVGM